MTELIKKISKIPDVYDDFIIGVVGYAKRKAEHVQLLNTFIDSYPDSTTSDVVEFIMSQPDFHNYSATSCEKVS